MTTDNLTGLSKIIRARHVVSERLQVAARAEPAIVTKDLHLVANGSPGVVPPLNTFGEEQPTTQTA